MFHTVDMGIWSLYHYDVMGVKVSTNWKKIHVNMCFDVVFLYENITTCLFTHFHVFSPFSAHFYPHYITVVKG